MRNSETLLPHIKLRFTIEHPNLEECYAYGYESALCGEPEESNPYVVRSKEHEYWAEGWLAGFYEGEPLFKLPESLPASEVKAANDYFYSPLGYIINNDFLVKVLKITGALAATAILGYQVLDLVA